MASACTSARSLPDSMASERRRRSRFAYAASTLLHLALALTSICLGSILLHSIPTAEATLAVRVNASATVNYRTWDPFQGEADFYTLPGVLLMGQVQRDCTVTVDPSAGPAGQAILAALDPTRSVVDSILVLKYDWLDYCATFDDIFEKLSSLNAQLQSLSLPEIGAVIMDGDANNNEDFGSPFTQLANAKHWNTEVRLNISYTGRDTVLALAALLAANNQALLATVVQEQGPWNQMWHSIGFIIVIRGLDVLAGLTFLYGLWVLAFILRDRAESQHYRRYLILIPGCIYLPLSIAFAPYKVTVPWRNCVYYMSLLLPFISLGLQITMWSKLIYRIKRKRANKLFSYFSYVTIFVPVVSSFLDGIGWLIPSVPIIRMIGEKGFSFVTPAVIIVQAGLIFYYAATFFKSLRGVAVSQTTRTALVKITVLNMAMISFFILMLLSRIVSLLGLNMKARSAYITELVIFRFSFIFFYAACFRTLSIRQPTGSTIDSKGQSSGGAAAGHHSSGTNKSASKNHTHYHMEDFSGSISKTHTNSYHEANNGDKSKTNLHFNKHLSNHASKGFTITDPSSTSNSFRSPSYGGAIASPKLTQGYTSQQQLLNTDSSEYPDPYKFNEFGHLTHHHHGEPSSSSSPSPTGRVREGESGYSRDETNYGLHLDGRYVEGLEEEDKDSVYGSHRFQSSPMSKHAQAIQLGNGGRVVSGKGRNSEGYARFDLSDEERNTRAL